MDSGAGRHNDGSLLRRREMDLAGRTLSHLAGPALAEAHLLHCRALLDRSWLVCVICQMVRKNTRTHAHAYSFIPSFHPFLMSPASDNDPANEVRCVPDRRLMRLDAYQRTGLSAPQP